jgi:hypothetical protein
MTLLPCRSPNAGGVPALGRGLSESASDTPGHGAKTKRTPAGCQQRLALPPRLRPLQGREIRGRMFRVCRSAQPPANRLHPSGMRPATTAAAANFSQGTP